MSNENLHRRDDFDKKLGMVMNNPKAFTSMFTTVIESSKKKESFKNMIVNPANIEDFYKNASVGEYEKMSDRLTGIMEDQNEVDVLVLIAALDVKGVNKRDELEAKKEAQKTAIPAPVSVPDFADGYDKEGSMTY